MTPTQGKKDNKLTTPQRVASLRGVIQVSWNELADALGVSRQMLLRVRKGERQFSPARMRRLKELEEQATALQARTAASVTEGHEDYLIRFGSATGTVSRRLQTLPADTLEAELQRAITDVLTAESGRDRLGKIHCAAMLLVELQERCFDEWAGKERGPGGSRTPAGR